MNALFVDSSAMPEQAVADILASAFDSAGQRCSALRVLCVQHDAAGHLLQMLRGAMAQWRTGPPWRLRNDVGPLIDPDALARVQAHLEAMTALGARVECLGDLDPDATHGLFQRPALVELALHQALPREVFGPVLHVVRYRREQRAQLEERIKAMGHGLTQGLHTRIEHDIERVAGEARVGNLYINRNMIGAVVGVQPFGGEGLSGTGPKAGGPLYLHRLLARRTPGLPVAACAGLTPRFAQDPPAPRPLLAVLARWADHTGQVRLAAQCRQFARCVQFPARGWRLAGPTGQDDLYQWHARDAVLCLAREDGDLLVQLAAVLAVGAEVLWSWQAAPLRQALPAELQAVVLLTDDWQQASFDLVLHHGDAAELGRINARLAAREGAIVAVHGLESGDDDIPLEMLLVERAISINTAASGGNASLMALPE